MSFVLINWFSFLNSDFSVCSSVYLFVNVYISRFKMVVRLTGSKFYRVVLSSILMEVSLRLFSYVILTTQFYVTGMKMFGYK